MQQSIKLITLDGSRETIAANRTKAWTFGTQKLLQIDGKRWASRKPGGTEALEMFTEDAIKIFAAGGGDHVVNGTGSPDVQYNVEIQAVTTSAELLKV